MSMIFSDFKTNPDGKVYYPKALDEMKDDPSGIIRTSAPLSKQVTRQLPIERTEKEIDMHWEYLKLMGRA